MKKLKLFFLDTFPSLFTSQCIQWSLLVLSLLMCFLIPPLSLKPHDPIKNQCTLEHQTYISIENTFLYDSFRTFLQRAYKKLDLVISFPENLTDFAFWTDIFEDLEKRKIKTRVFTNNEHFKFQSSHISFKYLLKDKNSFLMNFAIADEVQIFLPSTFYDPSFQNVSLPANTLYAFAILRQCLSAGADLTALFDLLWSGKFGNTNNVMKNKWVAGNSYITQHGTYNFSFLIEPQSTFPVNRPNITSSLYEIMSFSYLSKTIMSSSVFPDLTGDKLTQIDLSRKSSLISSFFEASSIAEDTQTYLLIPVEHYIKHRMAFRSVMPNMKTNSLSVCNDTRIYGTLIVASSFERNRLFLLPSGIADVFTGKMILGLVIDIQPDTQIEPFTDMIEQSMCYALGDPSM